MRSRTKRIPPAVVIAFFALFLVPGSPAALEADSLNQDFTGTLGDYEISGIVGNTSYERLEGVVVSLTGDAEMTDTTDAEGIYAFTGLVTGDYVVEPWLEGWSFEPARRTYTGLDADSLNQHFIGTQVAFRISGHVFTSTMSLVEGVVVALSGDATMADTTDAEGFYSLAGLPAGNYMVTPSMRGYDFSPASRTFDYLLADHDHENFIAAALGGSVKVVGGQSGYVDPARGEKATVIVLPRVPGSVLITVYTLRGETVFEARHPVEADEENTFEWDCTNRDGQAVAPGVYVLRVDGAGMTETRKIAVVR